MINNIRHMSRDLCSSGALVTIIEKRHVSYAEQDLAQGSVFVLTFIRNVEGLVRALFVSLGTSARNDNGT